MLSPLQLLLAAAAVAAAPSVSIMHIQGAGHTSPLAGDSVVTTGVVTAATRNGFYLQDPFGDAVDATSDGVFVFTGAAPGAVPGDSVRVTAAVNEYLPGGDRSNLTVTELDPARVEILARGSRLPAPVAIGAGGRVPPARVVDDDGLTRFEPARDGIDFYESLEGMRVVVCDAVVVGPTNRFGEVWVVADAGRDATGMAARGVITEDADDPNPERIQLDDALLVRSMPAFAVGARLGDVTGVVSYRYGNYEVLPSLLDAPAGGDPPAPETTALRDGADLLTVASFNVENLAPADSARIDALGAIIAHNLGAPAVVALQEIQDDSGARDDGTVDASATLAALAAAVARAGGPPYSFREIAPEDGRDGGAPGANIRPALLFDPARVAFVDRGSPSATEGVRVVAADSGAALSASPGRIEPENPAFVASRKPLVCELRADGVTVFVVVVHFSARTQESPLFGAVQPPVDPLESARVEQASAVARFVDAIRAVEPGARVVVLGDFNDPWFGPSAGALADGARLVNLTTRLASSERYTLLYEGNAQALDHVLVSPSLARGAGYDVVHVGAEDADGVSDHDPVVARLRLVEKPAPLRAPALGMPRPNPFADTTTVPYALVQPGLVAITVYDVCGRRVRRLLDGWRPAGADDVAWDGCDDRGARVASGVYFVRMAAGGAQARVRVLVTR